MTDKEKFFAQFKFDQSKVGFVGVEREQFTINPKTATIIPASCKYLDSIATRDGEIDKTRFRFGYELSACQLESKIGPCPMKDLGCWLRECDDVLSCLDRELGLGRINAELAIEDMPLDIYPDPTGRYQRITQNMPREVLSAACRVAATHVHIGMPDLAPAVEVYNNSIGHTDALIALGDHSAGKRMELYRVMAARHYPESILSVDEYYQRALSEGFIKDPRTCWALIRISIHGTVEFRMFGATDSIDQIVEWASYCHRLCTR